MESAISSCTHNKTHLCASPMKKPRKEFEMSENEEKQFTKINAKFAVHTLHEMWKSGKIYCNLGANLLMINPNRNIPTERNTQHICNRASISNHMAPFIQSITDNITHSQQNQSIIALGAGGSGKTHTTQQIVSHFVSQHSNHALHLVDLWNNVCTIYKVFGSHCKRHNAHSNGCAKIVKLIYESPQNLHGILCESLLWHKLIPSFISRTTHEDGIISGYFHIFSLVIAHPHYIQIPLTDQIKENEILLSYPSPFEDAHAGINLLQTCMNELMITSVAQKEILDVIYSILCLNQIDFISNDKSSITIHRNSLPFAKYICDILHWDPKDLLQYLMTQTVHTPHQSFVRPHESAQGAYKKIQRVCFILYECVVQWLFHHMDRLCLTAMDDQRVSHFISVIDFPGYTRTAPLHGANDFDAFCTNFCNENLQQLFNALILQSNQELYVEDGLNWIITPIPDYSKVIDLIASPPNGIFQILTQYPNESQLLHKINEYHPFKRQLITISKPHTAFTIHHYSGDVQYDVKQFASHNNCGVLHPKDDIVSLLTQSDLNLMKHFMESNDHKTENAVNTIHFQLRNLIKVIKTTSIHHVLCINPSQNNTDSHFSRDYVLSQIKSLSIVETLRDAIQGYAASIPSDKLLNIFHRYCEDISQLTAEQKCESILVLFGISNKNYKFGLSKVFIKHCALKQLRELECFDAAQLTPMHRTRLMQYIQNLKLHKWSGLTKTYGRLNYRLQQQRVLDSIKNVLCIQRLMRRAYKLKAKSMKSIPIFESKSNRHKHLKPNHSHDINPVLSFDGNIKIQLHHLFSSGCYYSKINPHIAVYLNPYSVSNLQQNAHNQAFMKQMVNDICSDMMRSHRTQSLILHGDTSSGKTTNFFWITNQIISNHDSKLHELVWASNQILVSLAHTSSAHNVNASRYIALRKFIFNAKGSIKGIQQNVKLLSPFIGESANDNWRNFHLFYEICNVLKNDSRFLLEKYSAFACLNTNIDAKTFGMSDNNQFVYFLRALKILNISTSKQQQICRLCAAILHLSNIECSGQDHTHQAATFHFSNFDKQFLFAAAYLLGVNMDKLCDILLPKSVQYFHETKHTAHRSQIVMQILHQRDALIKSLYALLFEYINHIINEQLEDYFAAHASNPHADDLNDEDKAFILMDIAGKTDENMDHNRFGDLAANYAFDTIQQCINRQHITESEKELMNEFEHYQCVTTYTDAKRLSLIDGQNKSVIAVLDYIDKHKYHKMDSGQLLHEMLQQRDGIQTNHTSFVLNHYPHHVSYDTKYTFEDAQPFEFEPLMQLLHSSSLSISRKLIRFGSQHKLFGFGQSFGHHRIHSVIQLYMNQLHEEDNAIKHHYLLCIRPNRNQDPSGWDSILVNKQLNAFHIPQILHIHQLAMPYTLPLIDTANKLSIVFGDTPSVLEMYAYNAALFIMALFSVFDIQSSSYKIGKRWIYLRDEETRDKVYHLLNVNTPLPPLQCRKFKRIYLQTKAHRVQHTISAYIRLSNAWNIRCVDSAKQQQRNAIECVLNYTRFLSPIIQIARMRVQEERIRRRQARERMKQEKLRELRRLEMAKKKLEQECEFEKQKRKNELHHLEQKWQSIEQQKQSEIARIERETEKAIMATQQMADEQLIEINESVFAHIHPLKDDMSVNSSVIDAMVEQKHAPQYKQLYNKMYKIQQQIKQLELQKRQSVIQVQKQNKAKPSPVFMKRDAPLPKYKRGGDEWLDLNHIIHECLGETDRKRAKELLKELYKYKQDQLNGKAVDPQLIFVSIRSLIQNAKPAIRYDLYKGFEELIWIKHIKMYRVLLKEVRKCGVQFREIMRSMDERDVDGKITAMQRHRIIDIADALHVHTLMDRKRVFQYLYELDGILKGLAHKDYVDIVALIEMVVNQHNLPMFVHIFQPLRAQKEFLTKISFYFSEAMYKIFKILLDQMMDNMESDDHNTNLDSIHRDLAKIFVKLPHHVNMDEILSEFLLYFVPPEYVHRFHEVTKRILSKRYEIIKMAQKNPNNQRIPKQRLARMDAAEATQSEDQYDMSDHRLLKKLKKDMDRLRKTTVQNQENLQQTVYDQLQLQSRQTTRMEDKIDDLQHTQKNIVPPPPPHLNEDKLIRRVTDILDHKITETYPKIQRHRKNAKMEDGGDPYIKFVNGCFDQFDLDKTDTIALDTMPKVLDLLDITGAKRETLLRGFHDMCKLTEPQIHRHQYLSALQHTRGKPFGAPPGLSPHHDATSTLQNITKQPSATAPLPPPPPPAHMIMKRINTISQQKSKSKYNSGKQPAVIVLPEGKRVRYLVEDEEEKDDNDNVDQSARKDKTATVHTPTVAKLLSDKECIHAWAMKKGDTFFKPNKKRYVMLSSHFFYWCVSDMAEYPKGGLNLHSHHVHVSKHGTTLRIKSSHKERIFNFGDIRTSTKFYDRMVQVQRTKHNAKNESHIEID